MDPEVYAKFREALRALSFGRHGMAAEALEELVTSTGHPECRFWLAYVYRRMRRYERAVEVLEKLPGGRADLEKLRAEGRSYELFRQAMELQGKGEYSKVRSLLEQAREDIGDDPDLGRWIEEELDFYRASIFD